MAGQIRVAGHEVVERVEKPRQLRALLAAWARLAAEQGAPAEPPCDAVVVAGGDGTVGRTARSLAGTGLPLAILALGTANNVARTFGAAGLPAGQIPGWDRAEAVGFDAMRWSEPGRASRAQLLFEGFGYGAFARTIRQAQAVLDGCEPRDKLAAQLALLGRSFAEAKLERYALRADGEDLSGEYLLVEALNIPFVGPRLPLAPRADPGDGLLDIVLAGEAERGPLVEAVERLARGEEPGFDPLVRRAARVVVSAAPHRCHGDGSLCAPPEGTVELGVERHAVRVLVPRREAG